MNGLRGFLQTCEICAEQQSLAIAYFASMFENGTYPQAIMFMMTETPEVYRTIMKFISGM